MRELNECTAEVFRRGEKRIKERRRNRNRVLALCIPACLVAAVWSVVVFPTMLPEWETSDLAQYAEEIAGDAERDLVYTAVEIQDAGIFPEEHYEEVTDKAAVAEMFRAIHSLFTDGDSNDQDGSQNGSAAENNTDYYDLAESESKWKVCTITFTTDDGSQTVYHLSGNTLVDVNANETIFLSYVQLARLKAVLGISE